MKDFLKNLLIYLFIFFIIFNEPILIYLQETTWLPNDYARIVDMDYKAVVVDEPDSQGKIVVTERFTFDVHAASEYNGFWELWRDLCEDYVDGLRVHYKVNSVKQILPNGSKIDWAESPKLYWDDYDYVKANKKLGPGKWFHSPGPYDEYYDRYECIFFYVDNLYREKITFEIEYEMYNAVLRYNDCSDLYIAMYSGDTTKYLENFNAEILIPNKDMPRTGNYKVTTYGTNNNNFPVNESATKNPGYHTFYFDLTKEDLKFRPYNEYIEFDLVSYGEDKHLFADYASINDYYNDDALDEIWEEQDYYINAPENFKVIKFVVLGICIFISIIVIISFKIRFSKWKDKIPSLSLSDDSVYRNIPSDLDPKFAATLVFCKDKKVVDDAGVYSSILLSLARKKYIELEETSGDFIIKITDNNIEKNDLMEIDDTIDITFENIDLLSQEEPLEALTTCESHYLNLIKRHAISGSIDMNTLQYRISSDYNYTNNFVKNMGKSIIDNGVGLGFFQKANYLEAKNSLLSSSKSSLIWGFLFLVLVNILSYRTRLDLVFGGYFILGITLLVTGLYTKSQAHKYILLTDYGEDEYKKWRGLYNFLKSDTLINEKTVIELPIWEKYLVYATAFGISEKVIKAIKVRCPEIQEETKSSASIIYHSSCRSGRIHSSGRSFHSAVRSGYHGYSSSSSSYGGGGRGGGGGGGGH